MEQQNQNQNQEQGSRMVSAFEATQAQTLARIDERTGALVITFKEFKESVDKKVDELKNEMKSDIVTLEKRLDEKVSNAEFRPIKLVVFGLVSLILVAFVGTLISHNLKSSEPITIIPNLSDNSK